MTKSRSTEAPAPDRVPAADTPETNPSAPWLKVVLDQVRATRFGVVQIVIHDSKVVQVDHTERTRFSGAESSRPA